MDGKYGYIKQVEQEIGEFHGAETALIRCLGFEANGAIYSGIPRPGDAIVFKEIVYASTHDRIAHSLALCKMLFRAWIDSEGVNPKVAVRASTAARQSKNGQNKGLGARLERARREI